MAHLVQKMLDFFKLTDEEEDFEEEEEMIESSRMIKREAKRETEFTERSQPQHAPKRFETRPMRSAQAQTVAKEEETTPEPRRVPMRQERQPIPLRSASQGLEVSIMKPTNFDDSKEICDMLKEERAIIINLEGLEAEQAQRMMDFISGAIYALDAKIHQISGYVFCISPAKVDISGDYINMISESTGFQIPNLLR